MSNRGRAFDGVTLTVHRVWAYHGPGVGELEPGTMRVAVELTVDIATGVEVDVHDIAIISADGGTTPDRGEPELFVRVTEDGELAAIDDPVFTEQSPLRLVAVAVIPATATAITLVHEERTLAEHLPLGAAGPMLPDTWTQTAIAYGTAGQTERGDTRHLVVVECVWSRAHEPPGFTLVDGKGRLRLSIKAVEVDDAMQPCESSQAYYARRRFVFEIWADAEARAEDGSLPATKLHPGPALLAALARVEVEPLLLDLMK